MLSRRVSKMRASPGAESGTACSQKVRHGFDPEPYNLSEAAKRAIWQDFRLRLASARIPVPFPSPIHKLKPPRALIGLHQGTLPRWERGSGSASGYAIAPLWSGRTYVLREQSS